MSNTVKLKSICPTLKVIQLKHARIGQFVYFVDQNEIDKPSMSIGYNEFTAQVDVYARGVVVEFIDNLKTKILAFYDNPIETSAVIEIDSEKLVVPLSCELILTPILK